MRAGRGPAVDPAGSLAPNGKQAMSGRAEGPEVEGVRKRAESATRTPLAQDAATHYLPCKSDSPIQVDIMKKSAPGFDSRTPGGKGTDRAAQTKEARARQARLAEALRDNLKKRKAQSRSRKDAGKG